MRIVQRDFSKLVASSVLPLVLAIWVTPTTHLRAQEEFETPPVLKASEVLPTEMQRGDHFTVREEVKNDGYMNYYLVESDYGQFDAYGGPALAKLIQEIGALAQLDEISKSEVFLEAVKRSATSQVDAVQDFADKPVETVKGAPGGLKRTFRKYKRDVEEGYEVAKDASGDVADTVTGSGSSDEGEEGGEGEDEDPSRSEEAKELANKGGEAAEAYAKKWFGVGATERRWHAQLGTDPYTTNEVLKKTIKELSKVDAATSVGMRFVPIPRIPGASELRALNQMVWNMDPRELREQNIKRLVEAGVEPELIEAFMNNPYFSPTMQTLLLTSTLEMEGVDGRRALLEIVSTSESTEKAQFDIGNILFLSAFHRAEEPIDHLLSGNVPVAITKDGGMFTIVSVDYAFWQKDLAGAITAFASVVKDLPATTREVWLRGKASPRFQEELAALGWAVRETIELEPLLRKDAEKKTGS